MSVLPGEYVDNTLVLPQGAKNEGTLVSLLTLTRKSPTAIAGSLVLGKRGSFRDARFGRTDSTYFRGRLNERRLRGRLRVTDRLRDGTRCASRWIVFNATPR